MTNFVTSTARLLVKKTELGLFALPGPAQPAHISWRRSSVLRLGRVCFHGKRRAARRPVFPGARPSRTKL
jgi:hypothetical protein